MTKLCIFDLDGTVLDTVETIAYYGNYALEKNGIAPIPVEQYKTLVGNGAKNLIQKMLQVRGCLTEERFQAVFSVYDAAYNANTSYKTKMYDGIFETLEAIKAAGIQIAILSNKPHFATCGVVKALFGDDYFDLVLGQREGYPLKPNPTVVQQIMSDFGVSPEECLYMGDTGTDMKTGKNAGIFTIGVLWGFRGIDELLASGADATVDTPQALLNYIQKG